MKWFIYDENVKEKDGRKKAKINWKNTTLIALQSLRQRCGEPTVFQYPRGPKTSRTIPKCDEGLNWSDKRDAGKEWVTWIIEMWVQDLQKKMRLEWGQSVKKNKEAGKTLETKN